jgi:DNA repair exonuclease SbcCD ATPase subunit
MKKKELINNLENLKRKTNKVHRLQSGLNEKVNKFKEEIRQLQRKELELETTSKKDHALLETVRPGFLTKIREQDIAIKSMSGYLDSLKKLQEMLVLEIKDLKGRLAVFNYKKIAKLDKGMNEKLKIMETIDANIEKNSKRFEEMFMEFEKNYLDFKQFKALGEKLNESFESYVERFNSLQEEYESCIKEKDLLTLKKQIDKLDNKIKESAKKKDLKKLRDKLKGKRRFFRWPFSIHLEKKKK